MSWITEIIMLVYRNRAECFVQKIDGLEDFNVANGIMFMCLTQSCQFQAPHHFYNGTNL
jgi:hypothetical protein